MAGQRVKANKNRKGKERKVRCNACGYARIKETPSFLHENLLCVGYANKSDFRELPIGKEVRCSEGSIGLQQNKHFFHDGVYYYHRAPFATVTCLYKKTFDEATQTRQLKINNCGYIAIKETDKWEHSRWLGIPAPEGFYTVDLKKFEVLDYEGKPSCTKWPDYGLSPGQFGPPSPPVYLHRYQRGVKKGDIGFDTKRHFYHPNSNHYYVYFGKEFAEQKIGLTYKRKLEGPVTNEDWEAVKQEFFKLVGENNPDLFVLRE
jgi:hypothetical protein